MEAIGEVRDVEIPLLLPGIEVDATIDGVPPVTSTQVQVFDGTVYVPANSRRLDRMEEHAMQYTVESMRTVPEGYAWSRFGQPEYTDWLDESLSWKQTCYIGDWSFLWQHRITGPDALQTAE